ncbi:MAG: NADH-quinone oxidoreductase subunit NuoE [Clostridia bacterium]|jgi:NADP-reducing hydrogenase subunit HndA|nr:NADH-quinone oxidoreductase subunit NuoE [Clostridia bacterium]
MGCQCQCGSEKKEDKFAFIDSIIERYKEQRGAMIPILHSIQQKFGYLSEEVQAYVAEKMGVPLSEIYGIVSFYALFTTQPQGKYKISVCMGTACYVRGAGIVLDELEKQLGVRVGETTKDGMFTLEACRCLGACGLAPVLTVNEHVHGRLTKDDVTDLIKKYRDEQ